MHRHATVSSFGRTSTSVTGWAWLAARWLGALLVLAMGAVHLHVYLGPYRAIPTINTLFLLNFVAATIVGALLLLPVEHLTGRWAGPAVTIVTLGGMAMAATSLAFLTVSERTPLFGFQEPGYDPTGIALSRQVEIGALVMLGASLVVRHVTKAVRRRW